MTPSCSSQSTTPGWCDVHDEPLRGDFCNGTDLGPSTREVAAALKRLESQGRDLRPEQGGTT